jgi:hypothetical protein
LIIVVKRKKQKKTEFEKEYVTDELVKRVMRDSSFTKLEISKFSRTISDLAITIAKNLQNILKICPQYRNSSIKGFGARLADADEQFASIYNTLKKYFIDCYQVKKEIIERL